MNNRDVLFCAVHYNTTFLNIYSGEKRGTSIGLIHCRVTVVSMLCYIQELVGRQPKATFRNRDSNSNALQRCPRYMRIQLKRPKWDPLQCNVRNLQSPSSWVMLVDDHRTDSFSLCLSQILICCHSRLVIMKAVEIPFLGTGSGWSVYL